MGCLCVCVCVGGHAYTTTYHPIPLLHPSVCKLMVSPFFPTDDRRSRLSTFSVKALGVR